MRSVRTRFRMGLGSEFESVGGGGYIGPVLDNVSVAAPPL
jgi:hypothetical protein